MDKKKRIVLIIRIVAAIVTIICIYKLAPWQSALIWLTPLPGTVAEEVDAAVDHGLDGIIVYVDQAGREPTWYAAGWKDRAAQIPADPHALFKIASLSKLYVAAAAAKLVTAQALSLDDTLAHHLPDLVGRMEYADQITLRMMLQHRSGIPNYTDHPDFDWSNPPPTDEAKLALVINKSADFKPNAKDAYCNTNFLLIGQILDKVLGYPHQDYIHKEITTPLGLTQTYANLSRVRLEDVVSGYHKSYKQDFKDVNFKGTGGSMIATARDVGVFLRALNDGTLLSPEEQVVYADIYRFDHTGWVLGYQSVARYHKDIDTVVIQFVNTTGGESITTTGVIYRRIVKILKKS